jgi:hypothetical protein
LGPCFSPKVALASGSDSEPSPAGPSFVCKKNAPDPLEQSPNATAPSALCGLQSASRVFLGRSKLDSKSKHLCEPGPRGKQLPGSCCGDEHRHGPGPLMARTCATVRVRVPFGVGPARAGRAWALARARTTAGAGVRLKKATEPGPRLRLDLISQTNASVPSRQMHQLPVRVVSRVLHWHGQTRIEGTSLAWAD